MRFRTESGPRFERTPETQELFRYPELAFDSDLESANKEYKQLIERLAERGEIYKSGERATLETIEKEQGRPPVIQITWPERGSYHMMLLLTPHVEGKGSEAGVFGYSGEYGVARRKRGDWEYNLIPLSELYGVPDNLNIVVKPTATRWTIAKDEMALAYGDNTRTLYMGLGFLLLGQQWMHVGMHEAGHLPNTDDENKAWSAANKYYASLHKPRRRDIVSGKDEGLFELLKRPEPYGTEPTIGKIVQYGLVSHAKAGNATIPRRWERKSREIMSDFNRVIEKANQQYDHFIGR